MILSIYKKYVNSIIKDTSSISNSDEDIADHEVVVEAVIHHKPAPNKGKKKNQKNLFYDT